MIWNGHKAAISLTFDDGLTCQLAYAVPAMARQKITGTFFLATDCGNYPIDVSEWRKAAHAGHEIGSHSVTHRKAAQLTPRDMRTETSISKRYLQEVFQGSRISSYCYPYTDAPAAYQAEVGKCYKQARGGRVARADKNVLPGDGVNLLNVPCYHISGSVLESSEGAEYIHEAIERGAWITLMFHGVGPDGKQWDNVPLHFFEALLGALVYGRNKRLLWVAPFGDVAEFYRGIK